jgi:hypothetical protein
MPNPVLDAFNEARGIREAEQQRQNAQGMANTQGKIENAFMSGNPQQASSLAQSSGDAGLMQGVQQRQQGIQQATRDQDGQRNDRLGQFATGLAATPVAQRGQAFDAIVPELFSYGLTPDQAVDIRSRLVDPNQSDAVISAYMSRSVSPDTMFEATAPRMQNENQVLNRFQGGELTQGPVNPNAPINQAVDQQNANTAQQRANTPRGPLVNVNTGQQPVDPYRAAVEGVEIDGLTSIMEAGDGATRNLVRLARLETLMNAAPQGLRGGLVSIASDFGLPVEGASEVQAAVALISAMVPEQRQPGSGPMSDADLDLFKRALPRLLNQPDGNRIIIETIRQINLYDQQAAEIARNAPDAATARAQLSQLQNPLAGFSRPRAVNPETGQAIEWDGSNWVPAQ